MAKLCISSQWDNGFLRECAQRGVAEAYGSLRTGAIGSARPAACLPSASLDEARAHVALAHELGVAFNYVINAPCMGNMEFDRDGRRAIHEYLEVVDSLGVDIVTVAIPYLIELIKHDLPHLKVKVSEIANVNTAQRARFYVERLGADVLTLEITINRDFEVLRSIRRAVPSSIELELVVNAACLYQCPYHDYHTVIVGHSGQQNHKLGGYYIDYCMMRCIPEHLASPAELIKARWIRPEDMADYEEIGITRFKISNRVGPLRLGRACLEAYSSRHCADLARLITPLSLNLDAPAQERLDSFPEAEWRRMIHIWGMPAPRVSIDNTQLDGFLDYFKQNYCYGQCDAGGCTYCATWARKAVRVDREAVLEYGRNVDQLIAPLLSLREQQSAHEDAAAQWTPEVSAALEGLLADVPEVFRDLARSGITRRIEQLVRERNGSGPTTDDLTRAALSETPDAFKPELIRTMTRLKLPVADAIGSASK